MEFEDYILNQNLSQDTVRTYNYAINQFKKFLKRDIEKASREDVMKFLTAVRNKELSPATIRLMIHALRSYYNGFLDNEIVMRNIKVPRLERRIKAWLSEADVIKLINFSPDFRSSKD